MNEHCQQLKTTLELTIQQLDVLGQLLNQVTNPNERKSLLRELAETRRVIGSLRAQIRRVCGPDPKVSWTPTPLTPVWYGSADAVGQPAPMRVWYPSARRDGPRLAGRYPLVVLVHGQCPADDTPHLRWEATARSVARSGYIVAAPHLGLVTPGPATVQRLASTVDWLLGASTYARSIHPAEIGIAGHSYGGFAAIDYALSGTLRPVSTIAILGTGLHHEDDEGRAEALRTGFRGARLFCWGGGDPFATVRDADWAEAAGAGHAVRFDTANHWDAFPPPTPCAGVLVERGPCEHTWRLTTDVMTVFFGKYLHPHLTVPPGHLPNTLIPPRLKLTAEQQPFAAGHLLAFAQLNHSGDATDCTGTSRWRTTVRPQRGTAVFPRVPRARQRRAPVRSTKPAPVGARLSIVE